MIFDAIESTTLPIISPLIKDYLEKKSTIVPLYKYTTNLKAFGSIIADKKANYTCRESLVTTFQKQYQSIETNALVKHQIKSLKDENTFTICTAHQLCLFTGPLYFIYKIVSAIKLCEQLKEKYPKQHFVPIYWMGSEDHDFEEINHLQLFGKTISWDSEQKGAVGQMSNKNLPDVAKTIKEIFNQDEKIDKLLSFFENDKDNYADSFQKMVNYLFEDYGLLVLNQDEKILKDCFQEEMKEELLHSFIEKEQATALDFLSENYKVQAAPRNINLFYLKEEIRERIISTEKGFEINNTELTFSREEMLEELKNYPERFSPNVSMRPLYQEKILPNLAYIGGGGELAYWLQQKEVFEKSNINFPMLLLRDMNIILSKSTQKKMTAWSLAYQDLFLPLDNLIKKIVLADSAQKLDIDTSKQDIEKVFIKLKQQAIRIDKSLEGSVNAELQKSIKGLENIYSKMLRAEKRNQEQLLQQIEKVQKSVFPNGKFQERFDNFLPYYSKYGNEFIKDLIQHFEPLSNQVTILRE